MFALPNQTTSKLMDDLARAAELGADQITTYPLFTFPYTSVGEYLHLAAMRMPKIESPKGAVPEDQPVVYPEWF